MAPTLRQLRQELHQHPELSGEEASTAERIVAFIRKYHNAEMVTGMGGNGLAAVYSFGEEGPTIMLRCELDALPISETNLFSHRSIKPGVSHKCGHDGHMAIVAGMIFWLKEQSFQRGKVVLLFQPAEENGRGAYAILNDENFKRLQPDFVFALHNLPGEPLHRIIVKEAVFTATVQSIAIYLQGKQAHASEPENGINPALAIAELINDFAALNRPDKEAPDFALLTPIHISLGEKAYGISAGLGELHYTMRTWGEKTMNDLKQALVEKIEKTCSQHQLQVRMEWFDYFPATVNEKHCVELVKRSAAASGYPIYERSHPLKFGEDFGWFSQRYRAAMFGVGAGMHTPALHHADYDFPDELIETGVHLFSGIVKELLG